MIEKKRMKIIIGVFLLSGAIMIGHGTRMMYQGLFHPKSIYSAPTPNTVDFYFDWMTLLVLGLFVFIYATFMFFKSQKNKNIQEKIDIDNIKFQAT